MSGQLSDHDGYAQKPGVEDIIAAAHRNTAWRRVLATSRHSQVALQSIPTGVDVGAEVHTVDQIVVFVSGTGYAELDGSKTDMGPGFIAFVPAGTRHNFTNTGPSALKLYTIYAPPNHKPGEVDQTKAGAAKVPAKPLSYGRPVSHAW